MRTRPWAAIARVPTAEGLLWFKQPAPANAFEPQLTEAVARQAPDFAPEVVAADDTRLLTADAGPSLRELEPDWESVLVRLAELQIALAQDVDELLGLGAPDKRPEVLPGSYRELVARTGLPAELRTRLHELEPAVERRASALGENIPPSIAHEEVHGGNLFVRDGRCRLLDWGEACISHPFAGLVNTLRAIVDGQGLEPGDPEVLRLRDVYLEPWTAFEPLPELRELFESAYVLGTICRALTWDAILAPLPAAEVEPFGHSVAAWLEIYAETEEHPEKLGA